MAKTRKARESSLRLVSQPAPKSAPKIDTTWAGHVPGGKPGTYAAGLPFTEPTNLPGNPILRPNKFTSRKSLFDFVNVLRGPAQQHGAKISTAGFINAPLKIREVLFVDTEDFRLYNNSFILRQRIPYTDGFPSGDPEIVFK